MGHAVAQLAEELRYKSERHRFDFRPIESLGLFNDLILPSILLPWVLLSFQQK